jgi:hypothetical protein
LYASAIVIKTWKYNKPANLDGMRVHMAHPEGFEPPACGLGNRCSILLSYGCTIQQIIFYISGYPLSTWQNQPFTVKAIAIYKIYCKIILKKYKPVLTKLLTLVF